MHDFENVHAYDHISSATMKETLRTIQLKLNNKSRAETIRDVIAAVRDGKITMDMLRHAEISRQYSILRNDNTKRCEMIRQLQALQDNTRVTWTDEMTRNTTIQRYGVIHGKHERMGYRIIKVRVDAKTNKPKWNHKSNEIVYVHPRYVRQVND
jgi:hypothetical protein